MDSYDRIIRVSPKMSNQIYWDQFLKEPWRTAGGEMPIPYYQAYGQMMEGYFDDQEDERDFERIKEMYPEIGKEIAGYVEEVCDQMEYEGSRMFDESPDRLMMRQTAAVIYDKMKERYPVEEKEDIDDALVMNQEVKRRYPRGKNWLSDLIEVMLYQEIYRRRCRRRGCKKWY